jgi:succinyl-diaminopimelate desuccinylase
VDEEGMMAGIKAFVRGGHAEGVDAAVICEPEENRICVEQKGALRVEVGSGAGWPTVLCPSAA